MERYAIEFHPNRERATFHLTVKVPTFAWLSSDTNPEGEAIREALESLPGVVEATGRRYSVNIQRGGAYRWDDIRGKVLDVLCENLNIEGIEEVEAFA